MSSKWTFRWIHWSQMPNAEEIRKRISETRLKNPTRYWLWKTLPEDMANRLRTINIWRKHTQERKDRMSLLHSQRPRKKATQQARINMSSAQKWKHSWNKCNLRKWWVSDENKKARLCVEYKIWREQVYERDAYQCKRCLDSKWWNLAPHHILNFSSHIELRYDINNWITLCNDCHNAFHKEYTCRDNTKEQLDVFLKDYITLNLTKFNICQ